MAFEASSDCGSSFSVTLSFLSGGSVPLHSLSGLMTNIMVSSGEIDFSSFTIGIQTGDSNIQAALDDSETSSPRVYSVFLYVTDLDTGTTY